MWIRRVLSYDSSKLEALLLSLTPEDRRFRFSGHVKDATIVQYVQSLRWREMCVYGMYDRAGALLGAVELVPTPSGTELAIAVAPNHKRKGIGRALMARAMVHAKLRGWRKLQILCTSDNKAMLRLAREVGMTLTREHGDVEGRVKVGRPTTSDYMAATWFRFDETVASSVLWADGAMAAYLSALRGFQPQTAQD